ncbi:MAG: SIS domain-containing protein [Acidobacteria bacterium]|nr:SIS domain-containing protein [Acidobacteriota bacterium]
MASKRDDVLGNGNAAASAVANQLTAASSLTQGQAHADDHESASPNPRVKAAAEVESFFELIVAELSALRTRAEVEAIEAGVDLILAREANGGRVHLTGIGKSEHVARYTASLFSSTGTPAYFLHATECVHGSAGQVRPEDVLIAISNSGTTPELLHAVEVLQAFGVKVICVSGQRRSRLAKISDVFLYAGVENEGGALNIVPRASILAKIYVLCALSVALESRKELTMEQYAQWHPSGALGRLARGE